MFFGKKSAKRYTIDYPNRGQEVPQPKVEQSKSLRHYLETDADFAAYVRRFVDNVLLEMPELIQVEGQTLTPEQLAEYKKQLFDVRFYRILRTAVYHLIWNGNAYIELKFSGTRLKEMYNIDPDTIEAIVDAHGVVIRYEQEVNGSPEVPFAPEEILHITIDKVDSGVYGQSFAQCLLDALQRKETAEAYLAFLIGNDKFAPIINVKSDAMTTEMWEHTLQQINMKRADPNFLQIINTFKEDELEIIRIFTPEDFDKIMLYIEEQKRQIMTALQVPPIIAGTVDNSNRSNSEVQARMVFFNTIKSFQNVLVDELNFSLLKLLNWTNVQFKFYTLDDRSDVELLKLAKSMRTELGMTQEAIGVFLKQNGFYLPNVKVLFDPEMIEKETSGMDKNSDEHPSREPRRKDGIPQNEEQLQSDKEEDMD
jgi:hypothetical protein